MKANIHGLQATVPRMLLLVGLLTGSVATSASEEHPAQVIVRETAGEVTSQLKANPALKEDRAKLRALIDGLVLPHFDFRRMSKRVLGKHWRKASDAEQAQFVEAFKSLLVRTYSTALAEYSDQEIEFRPPKENTARGEVKVRSAVRRAGAPAIAINYSMHSKGGAWRVYDVTVDGVSLVINYRSTFSSEIRKNGIAGLIERLNKRAQEG